MKKIEKKKHLGAPTPPEDEVICLFAGLLANPDMVLIQQSFALLVRLPRFVSVHRRLEVDFLGQIIWWSPDWFHFVFPTWKTFRSHLDTDAGSAVPRLCSPLCGLTFCQLQDYSSQYFLHPMVLSPFCFQPSFRTGLVHQFNWKWRASIWLGLMDTLNSSFIYSTLDNDPTPPVTNRSPYYFRHTCWVFVENLLPNWKHIFLFLKSFFLHYT